MEISFKASQSFVLRDGWIQKSLIEMQANPDVNVFSKKDGVVYLGVGSNMVTSIKYWLGATNIIVSKGKKAPELSDLGKMIVKYDPYLENTVSWTIIQMELATNFQDAPLFWYLFNVLGSNESFTKESFCEDLAAFIKDKGEEAKPQYIEDDFSVLTRSYLASGKTDPEDNMDCPLSTLGFLKQIGRGQYRKTEPSIESIDPRVVFYLVKHLPSVGDAIPFEDLVNVTEGPCKIFNLDRSTLMTMLMSLDNKGYVKVARSSGLNTIYINKKRYGLTDLFKDVFEGDKQ